MAKRKKKKNRNSEASNASWLGGFNSLLPKKRRDQFIIGAVVGAAAAYVLCDEALRGKLIKSGVRLYSSLVGGMAEVKEQIADVQAEIEAENSQA